MRPNTWEHHRRIGRVQRQPDRSIGTFFCHQEKLFGRQFCSIVRFIFGSNFGSCFGTVGPVLGPALGPVLGTSFGTINIIHIAGLENGAQNGTQNRTPNLNQKLNQKRFTVCGQNKFLVAVSGQRTAPEDFVRGRRTMPFCGEVVRRWIEVKKRTTKQTGTHFE